MKRWEPTRRAELEYTADLLGILRQFFSAGYTEGVQLLSRPEWLEAWSRQAAERMVTHQAVANARSWREAAREGGRGPQIYSALARELQGRVGVRYRALVEENASLISSLPYELARVATARAAQHERAGGRAASFSGEGRLFATLARSRAQLIARTEIAKANAALTQARAEDLGLEWYVWETSRDARVRLSHRRMQGVLFRFDDPPSPEALVGLRTYGHYNAGNIFNCRCYAAPLIRLSQVAWPHRCYVGGVIRSVTLVEFRRMNHFAAKEAA